MIVSRGIDSSMVHRRQCSFWESSRFDCSEAACRIRPFGVDTSRSVPGGRRGSTAGQERALDQTKSSPLSGQSRCAVSLSPSLWSPDGLQGAHKCHWIELSRTSDDFVT
jgi:hypothetical protein